MSSLKAAKRAERQQAKREKARQLVDKFSAQSTEKSIRYSIDIPECPKRPITLQERQVVLDKVPKINPKPGNYDSPMTWCPSLSDLEESWSWGELRQWSEEEWQSEILRELEGLRSQTWSEIARMTTGEAKRRKNRRKKHHPQPIADIASEAKKRWLELDLEQFETAYRFRLGGSKRAWGFQSGAHFYLVWYEREHNIYPL